MGSEGKPTLQTLVCARLSRTLLHRHPHHTLTHIIQRPTHKHTHFTGHLVATATPGFITALLPLYKLPVPSSVPRNHLPNIRILKNMARF